MKPNCKLKALCLANLLAPLAVFAAQPVVPDAGSILQQMQPERQQRPLPSAPVLRIEQPGGQKAAPTPPFMVSSIRIRGNTAFDTEALHNLVADGEGKQLTLIQLQELAARLTDHYHAHGYPLARAIVPAQTISDGVVTIEVIEGRYGRIRLDNSSRVDDSLLRSTLVELRSGETVDQRTLERGLLLLSDVPGAVSSATLLPGDAVGTSDLVVNVTPGADFAGSAILDNFGNRYTGRTRLSATVSFINPLQHGDVLSLNAIATGEDMNYLRADYSYMLNGSGTRMGGNLSVLRYRLGDNLSSLHAHGTAEVGSLWLRQPLLRSSNTNVSGQIQYDHVNLRDHVDTANVRTDRHLDNWTASVSGDLRDAFLSTAVSSWSFAWTSGHLRFDDTAAQSADSATANTQGTFTRWNMTFARLQEITSQTSVYFALIGQWSDGNLDSSQRMVVGGPYSVRAYNQGALSGDRGLQETLELRRSLGTLWQGLCELVLFADHAQLTVNRNSWRSGSNTARLAGTGIGLNWSGPEQWFARLFAAARIGSAPELVQPAASSRVWAEIGKRF